MVGDLKRGAPFTTVSFYPEKPEKLVIFVCTFSIKV